MEDVLLQADCGVPVCSSPPHIPARAAAGSSQPATAGRAAAAVPAAAAGAAGAAAAEGAAGKVARCSTDGGLPQLPGRLAGVLSEDDGGGECVEE